MLTGSGFDAWRKRLESKFGASTSGGLSLSYSLDAATMLPLDGPRDVLSMSAAYMRLLPLHTKASTFRIAVCAKPKRSPLAAAAAAALMSRASTAAAAATTASINGGVQTRRQRSSAPPSLAPEPEPEPVIAIRYASCRIRDDSPATKGLSPTSKKPRGKRGAHSPVSIAVCVTPGSRGAIDSGAPTVVAQPPDICWESVLKSIAKTIDKHHFGSKLKDQAGKS